MVQKHEYRFTPLKPDSAFGQERFPDAIIPAEVKTVFWRACLWFYAFRNACLSVFE